VKQRSLPIEGYSSSQIITGDLSNIR
jgi:hypothetical protein